MKRSIWLVLILCTSFWPRLEAAITITPIFTDGAGETWTADRQAVVNQAIADWSSRIADNYSLTVTFDFTSVESSYLARWSGGYSAFEGDDVTPWYSGTSHTIHFNKYYFTGDNYLWWDPTPLTSNDQPFEAWDALSVARHELGHALGFSTLFVENVGTPQARNYWSSHVTGSTFDPGGLNVALAASDNITHLADIAPTEDYLMTPAIVNGQRRGISDLELDMVSLSLGYTVVPEPYSALGCAFGLALVVMIRRLKRCQSD